MRTTLDTVLSAATPLSGSYLQVIHNHTKLSTTDLSTAYPQTSYTQTFPQQRLTNELSTRPHKNFKNLL